MMYLLAIFIPPLAVLLVGKPIQALINFALWCFFWIPGSIHAVMVVSEHKADKRAERQAKIIAKESQPAFNELAVSKTVEIETPKKAKKKKHVSFKVAGVTFENDKGRDIQKLLRQLALGIAEKDEFELYDGWSNKEIIEYNAEIGEFESIEAGDYVSFEKDPLNKYDKKAIKIIMELDGIKHHVGYVPKTERDKVAELLNSESIEYIEAEFTGGNIKEVDYDDEKDKDVIAITELTMGVEITIYIKED